MSHRFDADGPIGGNREMMRVLYVAIRVLNDLDTCVGSRTLLPSPLSRFVVVVDGIDRKTEAD